MKKNRTNSTKPICRVLLFLLIFRARSAIGTTPRIRGSPGRTRTADKVVNSHLLYRLSYRGMVVARSIPRPLRVAGGRGFEPR
jgi:hypothetical protein